MIGDKKVQIRAVAACALRVALPPERASQNLKRN